MLEVAVYYHSENGFGGFLWFSPDYDVNQENCTVFRMTVVIKSA